MILAASWEDVNMYKCPFHQEDYNFIGETGCKTCKKLNDTKIVSVKLQFCRVEWSSSSKVQPAMSWSERDPWEVGLFGRPQEDRAGIRVGVLRLGGGRKSGPGRGTCVSGCMEVGKERTCPERVRGRNYWVWAEFKWGEGIMLRRSRLYVRIRSFHLPLWAVGALEGFRLSKGLILAQLMF